MTYRSMLAAAALLALASAGPAIAQGAGVPPPQGAPGAQPTAPTPDPPARSSRRRKSKEPGAASRKEPTVSQLAARERLKTCAAEWRTLKASGKVVPGTKWPKFWSRCNTRLKEQKA